MALDISKLGAQGQPWWFDVVSEARRTHSEWLNMTSRDKAQLEAINALENFIPTTTNNKLESILR
eukprot:11310379-Prorocentrum_lima.AAC.1